MPSKDTPKIGIKIYGMTLLIIQLNMGQWNFNYYNQSKVNKEIIEKILESLCSKKVINEKLSLEITFAFIEKILNKN